jgi:hypothetical protein
MAEKFKIGSYELKGILEEAAKQLKATPSTRWTLDEMWTKFGKQWTINENGKHPNQTPSEAEKWNFKNREMLKKAFFDKPVSPFKLDGDKAYYEPFSALASSFFTDFSCCANTYMDVMESARPTIKVLLNWAEKKKISIPTKKRKREEIVGQIFTSCGLANLEEVEKNGFVSSKTAKDTAGNDLHAIREIVGDTTSGKEIFYWIRWEATGDLDKVHSSQLEKCGTLLNKYWTKVLE